MSDTLTGTSQPKLAIPNLSRRAALAAVASALPLAAKDEPTKIDCQSHLFSEEFLQLLEQRKTSPYIYRKGPDRFVVVGNWHRRILPKHTDVAAKLADMDANGIRKAAISINDPGPELFAGESGAMAKLLNDFVADTTEQHPDRFFGLATLPFDSRQSMMREYERAMGKLGMKGVLLYSNIGGKFPDEPEWRPLFAEAARQEVPILLHPACPTTFDATNGYDMAAGLGLMFDTTIALTRIILSGILEDYPNLKLVCPHVGGALPYLIGRVDHQTMVLKRGADRIKKAPSEYLKQIYLDTVSPIAAAIRYGIDFVGSERMLFSTDHPWVAPQAILGQIEKLSLDAATQQAIFKTNAERLFRL
jgi:predicted TIM-barrel fold metal-dependent hydrolase